MSMSYFLSGLSSSTTAAHGLDNNETTRWFSNSNFWRRRANGFLPLFELWMRSEVCREFCNGQDTVAMS